MTCAVEAKIIHTLAMLHVLFFFASALSLNGKGTETRAKFTVVRLSYA